MYIKYVCRYKFNVDITSIKVCRKCRYISVIYYYVFICKAQLPKQLIVSSEYSKPEFRQWSKFKMLSPRYGLVRNIQVRRTQKAYNIPGGCPVLSTDILIVNSGRFLKILGLGSDTAFSYLMQLTFLSMREQECSNSTILGTLWTSFSKLSTYFSFGIQHFLAELTAQGWYGLTILVLSYRQINSNFKKSCIF